MSVFKLANDHPLTKAGLRWIHAVEDAGRGVRPGDIVFEFRFGHIVDTGMACKRNGIIPPGVDLMDVHKEATALRAARNKQGQELTAENVLLSDERVRYRPLHPERASLAKGCH
jgi:hypothetical protein